jgi:polysaccharide deacetylase 2 family uncharacterized protein YibQ
MKVRVLIPLLFLSCMAAVCQEQSDQWQPQEPIAGRLQPPIVENVGRADQQARFVCCGSASAVFFGQDGLTLVLREKSPSPKPDKLPTVMHKGDAELVGASTLEILANRRASAKVKRPSKACTLAISFPGNVEGAGAPLCQANRLIGKNASVRTSVYGGLICRNVSPGINLVVRQEKTSACCFMVVPPGADISRLTMKYEGQDGLELARSGELLLKTSIGKLKEPRPVAYQIVNGQKSSLRVSYSLDGSTVGFRVSGQDPSLPVTIECLGLIANALSDGWELAKCPQVFALRDHQTVGPTYAVEQTFSPPFPTSMGAVEGQYDDLLIAKMDPSGSPAVVTFLGGSGLDIGSAIAADAEGSIYLTGETFSPDFPVTEGDSTGPFALKLDAAGDKLSYSVILRKANPITQLAGRKLIAIVIDDGAREEQVRPLLDLHVPLTFALLPWADAEALEAVKSSGCAVLVHAPMMPLSGRVSSRSPNVGMMSSKSSCAEIETLLADWLAKLPGAIGVSNHMGSQVTSDPQAMKCLLADLQKRNLQFLDSNTSPVAIAADVAAGLGATCIQQDLFLDSRDPAQTAALLRALADLSERSGYAIGIGHVGGASTREGLAQAIPELQKQGFQFITLPELFSAMSPPAGFHEDFSGGKADPGWQTHCSAGNEIAIRDGFAEINADYNTYAHLTRPLDADNVTVSARIKPSSPAGVTWCTSVFLEWNAGNWCQMGMIPSAGGNRYYAVETVNGSTSESYLPDCSKQDWHYVRIQLGRDCIRYLASDDGKDWDCLRVIRRPAEFQGKVASLAVGKGYSRGVAPYPNSDLDNDYSDRGNKVVSMVADIRMEGTPLDKLSLTPAERSAIEEADLDPVGKIELRGAADPTFENVARYFPPMKFPREAIGVPEHPQDIGVDYQGRLQFTSAITSSSFPMAWFEVGDPPVPLGSTTLKRRLLNGYMPIVVLAASQKGVEYEQTQFGWSEGMSPDAELFAFVRLKAKGATPGGVWLTIQPANSRIFFEGNDVCVKIPYADPAKAKIIPPVEYDQALAQATQVWEALIEKGARFDLPDPRVNSAYRAWLAYSFLNVDKINGIYEPHDGAGFYEENYGYSVELYCRMLDAYGMHDLAAKYLDSTLSFQQPDGLYTQNFGLPDVGGLVSALAEHYRLTGDNAWLQRVSKHIILACDYLMDKRAAAPTSGLTRGMIKYRPYCDYPEPTFNYFIDIYSCKGLEDAAEVLSDQSDMSDLSDRYAHEALRYRADILASMDKAAFRQGDLTVLPIEPDTHRILKDSHDKAGDYYGLNASILLENGFLDYDGKQSRWITDFMEQKSGLIAGLCRFQPGGIDHAYTYGYLLTQLKRGDARKVLLGFYGMLAYGMTQDTYSGVECTIATTGENAHTLPHTYSCTQQLRLLRDMLIREDGDCLRIGEAIPRAWLADGKKIEMNDVPTSFGKVSVRMVGKKDGIEVEIDPTDRSDPTDPTDHPNSVFVTLRTPRPIKAVRLDGKPVRLRGETLELAGTKKRVRLEAMY